MLSLPRSDTSVANGPISKVVHHSPRWKELINQSSHKIPIGVDGFGGGQYRKEEEEEEGGGGLLMV